VSTFVAFEFDNLRVGAWCTLGHLLLHEIEAIILVTCSAELGELAV
jgi:hypothetical protein